MSIAEALLMAHLVLCPSHKATLHLQGTGVRYEARLFHQQADPFWPTTDGLIIDRIGPGEDFDSHVIRYTRNNFQPLAQSVREEGHYDRTGNLK